MKNYLLLILLILFCLVSRAQIAYYDAIDLSGYTTDGLWNLDDHQKIWKSIRSYYPKESDQITRKRLQELLNENPFFVEMIGGTLESDEESELLNKESMVSPKSLFKSVGGLNVTNLADGLTQHIISNAKEELNIAFFRKFKKFVDSNPEFQILFPESTRVISNLLEYQYNIMLSVLQDAFIQDANNLINQLDDLLELPRLKPVRDQFPEILIVIEILQVADDLEKNMNVADILTKLEGLDTWNKEWNNLAPTTRQFYEILALGDIVSTSVRSKNSDKIWISQNEFNVLVNDPIATQIFVGLVYQKIKNAAALKNSSPVLDKTLIYVGKIKSDEAIDVLVNDFYVLANDISMAKEGIWKTKTEFKKPSNEQIYTYIDVSLRAMDYGSRIVCKIDPNTNYKGGMIDMLHDANSAYRAVYQKNYTVSVHYTAKVLESTLSLIDVSDAKKKKVEKLLEKVEGATSTDLQVLKAEADGINIDVSNINNLPDLTLSVEASLSVVRANEMVNEGSKYLQLIALLADANSAEEAKSAIEAVALPAGSSSLKKYQKFNVNVSSYLGAGLRLGAIEEVNRSWDKQWFVYMPIGIGINKGFGKGGSASLNLNFFDLGAIAAFRLEEDTLGNKTIDEEIVLGNIFSPGVMINYGFFGDLPLSLGIGCQLGPGLRSIDENDGVTFNSIYGSELRWIATLAIDVPLLNIHNGKTKIRKR